MPITPRDGGVFKTASPKVKSGGVWNQVQHGYVKNAGVWSPFFVNLLSASANTSAAGSCNNGQVNSSPCTVTTNTVTITAVGGTGSYTYAWSILSGDAYTILSPTSAGTQFRLSDSTPSSHSATARCVISDGTQTATVDVSVSSQHNNLQ